MFGAGALPEDATTSSALARMEIVMERLRLQLSRQQEQDDKLMQAIDQQKHAFETRAEEPGADVHGPAGSGPEAGHRPGPADRAAERGAGSRGPAATGPHASDTAAGGAAAGVPGSPGIEQQPPPQQQQGVRPGGPWVRLPLGSTVTGELMTGAFATKIRGDALPVLVQLRSAYTGPNDTEIPLEDCLLIGKATADISSVRARVEAVSLSCVLPDGTAFERQVKGYFTGQDGTLGVPGKWEFRSGRWLANLLSAMGTVAAGVYADIKIAEALGGRGHPGEHQRLGHHQPHPGLLYRAGGRDSPRGVDRERLAGLRCDAGGADHRGSARRSVCTRCPVGVGLMNEATRREHVGVGVRLREGPPLFLYGLAVFVSASLVFWVQPLAVRGLLPAVGGAPLVWNTAMLFFQAMLLAGYLLAHLLVRQLAARGQFAVLAALWSAALLAAWSGGLTLFGGTPPQTGVVLPALWVLGTLGATYGPGCLVVSMLSPLVSAWFARTNDVSADPYVLYAVSNVGSIGILLVYPFVLEPLFGVALQLELWTAVFALLSVPLLVLVLASRRKAGPLVIARPDVMRMFGTGHGVSLPRRTALRVLILALLPSALLYGVTLRLSTDVAAAPLLWVLPLSLYLGTYALAFGRGRVFTRWRETLASRLVPVALVLFAVFHGFTDAGLWWVVFHLAVFGGGGVLVPRPAVGAAAR